MTIAPVITLNRSTNILREREFRQPADIFVRIGQKVNYQDIIGEETLSPEYSLLDIADGLGIEKTQAIKKIIVHQGDSIHKGDLVAGPDGAGRRVVRSPIEGHVLLVHDHQVILQKKNPLQAVEACIPGEIVDISDHGTVTISTTGALFDGIWGNGGITYGTLRCIENEIGIVNDMQINQDLILYLSTCMKTQTVEFFLQNPPKSLVIGSCSPHLVPIILSYPFPVMILIGFYASETNPESIQQIAQFEGSTVTVDAAKVDHHNGTYPALLIPHTEPITSGNIKGAGFLQAGSRIRITQTPHLGLCGTIIDFEDEAEFPSGIRADCAIIQLSNEEIIKVPIFNLEILA